MSRIERQHGIMEKVWEIKDPDALLREMEGKGVKKRQMVSRPSGEERDPGRAYTLSLLCWGGGQLYNGQIGKGVSFVITMLLFLSGIVLAVLYWDPAFTFLVRHAVSRAGSLLTAQILLLCFFLFWAYNASDAYHTALRSRRTPFTGTTSRAFPLVGSLLMPGWGQFLNGQPVKGGIFAALAILEAFAVVSVTTTFLAWPYLDASRARTILEGVSAVGMLAFPLLPVLWVLSSYDAYSVSSDELYKEPLRERLRAAYFRGRTQGWIRGVFPNISQTVLFVLLLAFFVIVVHNWFPSGYYARLLTGVQSVLRKRGMTILPELITLLLTLLEA